MSNLDHRAMTREEYYAEVERLGRPVTWQRGWFRRDSAVLRADATAREQGRSTVTGGRVAPRMHGAGT